MDRHGGPKNRFLEFCERVSKKENKERQAREKIKAIRE